MRNPSRTAAALVLAALIATPALAQPLPESVPVGNSHMTIGFELKTTDKGSGPGGLSTSHTLMDYIIPKPGATWSEAARADVERWGSMSRAERTAFFFANYAGGYYANNFVVDTVKYPWADKVVSWYGKSLNIPHIEIRSAPFDNPREAMATMNQLRSGVSETIAFHMHLRFPDTGLSGRAANMAEYLRRTSMAIFGRRADYSSKTDFVLKQADNQPVTPTEVDRIAERLANSNATGEIMGRRGVRVNRMNGEGSEKLIDIEFRGLMKDTGRLESYLRATANAFAEGGTGGPWSHTAESPFFKPENSVNVALERERPWSPSNLEALVRETTSANERYGVSTSLEGEALGREIRRLATADSDAGKRTLLPSSFDWLFQPIEYDPALPEGIQEEIEAKKKKYLRRLMSLAERNAAGEFGTGSEYKPISVASRARKILHDFINETYTDGNKTKKLFEWYETSLFKPEEITERTERWRNETGKNRAEAYHAARAERAAARANAAGTGDGFSTRRVPAIDRNNPFVRSHWDKADALSEMEKVREGAMRTLRGELYAPEFAEKRAEIERAMDRLSKVTFELFPDFDLRAEVVSRSTFSPEAKGEIVRISYGLLNEIQRRAVAADPSSAARAEAARDIPRMPSLSEIAGPKALELRARILGLIVGHELAHVTGLKAEGASDLRGVEFLEAAKGKVSDVVIREAVNAFNAPTGNSHLSNLIYRLKSFTRYGTPGMRRAAMERAAAGEADPYARFRRADGTIEWKKLGRSRAGVEAAGLAQFGMALFLKELAVVAKTGDRARINEFFDGLMTTDFYKEYGLFVMGARVGEVAYARYLERFVKPRFVNSIVKTNVILAAGLALPQIVNGTFTGKAFAISLGSLGLSSAAVKTGVAGLKWVVDLKTAKPATLGRLGLRAAKFGGWFYHAAELAVVLYFAEEIEHRVNAFLDERAARNALADAGETFYSALAEAETPEAVDQASEAYHDAWTAYRDHLYAPLTEDEAIFAARMEKAAREAKLIEDRREATRGRLAKFPALRDRAMASHGSLAAYADASVADDFADLDRDIANATRSYNTNREAHLAEVYEGNRREGGLLEGVDDLTWLARGARDDADDAPYSGRGDFFANMARNNARSNFRDALYDASGNRLQAYEDELATLALAREALASRGREDLTGALDALSERVERTHGMDDALIHGTANGLLETGPSTVGASERIDELGR